MPSKNLLLAWLAALAWCGFSCLPVTLGLYQRFWEIGIRFPRALWEAYRIELDRSAIFAALVASLLLEEPAWRIIWAPLLLAIPRGFSSFRGLGLVSDGCPLAKGIRVLKPGVTVFLISTFAPNRPHLDESAGHVYLPEHLLSRLDRPAIDGLAALQLATSRLPFWMLFLQLEVPLLLLAWPQQWMAILIAHFAVTCFFSFRSLRRRRAGLDSAARELAGSPYTLIRAIHGSCLVQGRCLTGIGWLPRLLGIEAPIDRIAALAAAGHLPATRADLYRMLAVTPDPDRYPLPDLIPNSSGT